ncbi:MAG TPA: GAF domain-containing protein [Acidocella sp.]|jgi:transcriptional regulator of acetoin/glycerol metabolism|nr:GAF domain-containing protein [Acidocella sp.]
MTREDSRHSNAVLDAVRSPEKAAASSVVASWRRSALYHRLDPTDAAKREQVDGSTLDQLCDAHGSLLAVARPILDEMFRAVGRSGCCVILSNEHGVILEERLEPGDLPAFASIGLVTGGRWSEAEEGTNGIGTCLYEGQPVTIHRGQHFASRNIGISCMDAPVHDPHGRLLAALDVSSCRYDHDTAAAGMIAVLVRDAARRIERDYFCRHFAGARIIFLGDAPEAGMALLAVDQDDLVLGASRGARLNLRLTDDMLATPRPLAQLLGSGATASFDDGERAVLRRALASASGNASKAARLLGVSRATLYRRMAQAKLRR